ncbi:SET methyltransferase domain containing protein [Nitzschia inconspicua]|uniref:SET methyltransferase domain containing protein n=1 Tax=Nitzschia inconspicua TaxID=303405 RepID=A0A9K3PQN2_9STRA|nr:SET methyltransferase domain containing protein [Nitzschia inconspicua]
MSSLSSRIDATNIDPIIPTLGGTNSVQCVYSNTRRKKDKTCNIFTFLSTLLFFAATTTVGASPSSIPPPPPQQQQQSTNDPTTTQPQDCGLYLAPSTIPGAGLGVFAGNKPYKKGDRLAPPDLMIPAYDMTWHNDDKGYHFLWDEYTWSTTMFPDMEDDIEDPFEQSSIISSGFGAAINCMLPLVNVADHESDGYGDGYQLTTSGVSSQSPGAGAFTPMTGRIFVASKDIEPFSELYADYGEGYFSGRSSYDSVPLFDDYEKADKLIGQYMKRLKAMKSNASIKEDLELVDLLNTTEFENDIWNFMIETRSIWRKSRLLHALPGPNMSIPELENLMEFGGTGMQHYNSSIKSQEWMEEHGQCMDNIHDGVSNIPHAGRGAFASKFIPEGGLVSPAPLIHIPDRKILRVYEDHDHPETPHHHQLLLNYCFGHAESTLLLCPYGLLNFLINHDAKNPNTKIQWSKKHRHPEWFNQPISEWGHSYHNGLSFDFVALRDINPGEEITIDYGEEWEAAWQEHVKQFDNPRPKYIPAFELNKMDDLIIPTCFEVDYQFENVLMFCRQHFFPTAFEVKPYRFGFEEEEDYGEYYLCRAFSRNETSRTYTVEVIERENCANKGNYEVVVKTYKDTPKLILFDIPRDAFFFRDIPYTRDHHQFWSFRHDMRIPNDMFPDIWKTDDVVGDI